MKFLKERAEERRKEFYSHVSPEMKALAERDEPISLDEWNNIRANSYERKLLHRNLSNEALIYLSNYCIDQAGGRLSEFQIPAHYNESVQKEQAPLLADRLSIIENTTPACQSKDCILFSGESIAECSKFACPNRITITKLNVEEGDILLLQADVDNMPEHTHEEIFKVLPNNVNILAIPNDMSFDAMSDQEIDDMLRLLCRRNTLLGERLKEVLIRNVGNNRDCPACGKSVGITDYLSKNTFNMYKQLFGVKRK